MAKRTINAYKSYSFKDKDPVIDRLRTIIQDESVSYAEIHAMSGVTQTTLWNWFSGSTKRPQFATVMAVARSLGYDMQIVKADTTGRSRVIIREFKRAS
jgi:transcriptional regulator with XRE-family HTH domain